MKQKTRKQPMIFMAKCLFEKHFPWDSDVYKRQNLTRAGYACDCAYDGLAAVDMLDKKPYDLVLLDIMLPGADGYEIMDYIAPLEIPVIFLTAKASVADRVKGLRMGADDYLTKPFEIIELLARVESVLRRYHKTEQVLTEGCLLYTSFATADGTFPMRLFERG